MTEKLHVSVVMPSYNQAKFIKEAIDSVLSQDYPLLDLLVMDGGSRDGTVEILKAYGDKIAFVSRPDKGQTDAINQGLSRVEGDIVCWLNSDDCFTPEAIPTVAQAFAEHPEVDFVYGKGWSIDEDGKLMGDADVLPFDCWKLIHQRNFIQQPSCFFRKSLLHKVGKLDETLHYVMDWDFWIRLASYQGLYLDRYLSCNRIYRSTKTQSGQFRRWREIRTMIRRYTNAKWPPALNLYLLEAMIQLLGGWPASKILTWPFRRLFLWGLKQEMSGRYPDGGIEAKFRFSASSPGMKSSVQVTFTPLSKQDAARLGKSPVTIHWKSSTGRKGEFSLLENGQPQKFALPLEATKYGFTHFYCLANYSGKPIRAGEGLPPRKIIGFLDEIKVQD